MFRKFAILFLFLLFLCIGFFGIVLEKQIENQNSNTTHYYSEAESYCLWKGGELFTEENAIYCGIHGNKEPVQLFFERLGQ